MVRLTSSQIQVGLVLIVLGILFFAGCLTHSKELQNIGENGSVVKSKDTLVNSLNITPAWTDTKEAPSSSVLMADPVIDGVNLSIYNETFILEGTTNLRPGRRLIITVEDPYFGPQNKMSDTKYFGASGLAIVQKRENPERNYWRIGFPEASIPPGTYLLTIESPGIDTVQSELFIRKI